MTEPALTPVSPAISSAVERLMRRVEDFPSAGVQFCDLTPVLADADGFDAVVAGLIAGHAIGSVDYVAGLDARGFLLAGAAAVRLHTGVLAIRKAGKPLLESVELIDRFEGGQLADDQCSQAFRIRYRGKDSTLTDDQLQPVHEKVRQALAKQFKAELRS